MELLPGHVTHWPTDSNVSSAHAAHTSKSHKQVTHTTGSGENAAVSSGRQVKEPRAGRFSRGSHKRAMLADSPAQPVSSL